MTKGAYQEQMQVPEPLPVDNQQPDWTGISMFVTALAGLITAVGGVWGRRKLSKHIEKRRKTNPGYLKMKKSQW